MLCSLLLLPLLLLLLLRVLLFSPPPPPLLPSLPLSQPSFPFFFRSHPPLQSCVCRLYLTEGPALRSFNNNTVSILMLISPPSLPNVALSPSPLFLFFFFFSAFSLSFRVFFWLKFFLCRFYVFIRHVKRRGTRRAGKAEREEEVEGPRGMRSGGGRGCTEIERGRRRRGTKEEEEEEEER